MLPWSPCWIENLALALWLFLLSLHKLQSSLSFKIAFVSHVLLLPYFCWTYNKTPEAGSLTLYCVCFSLRCVVPSSGRLLCQRAELHMDMRNFSLAVQDANSLCRMKPFWKKVRQSELAVQGPAKLSSGLCHVYTALKYRSDLIMFKSWLFLVIVFTASLPIEHKCCHHRNISTETLQVWIAFHMYSRILELLCSSVYIPRIVVHHELLKFV